MRLFADIFFDIFFDIFHHREIQSLPQSITEL